jgi:hypothetical protein
MLRLVKIVLPLLLLALLFQNCSEQNGGGGGTVVTNPMTSQTAAQQVTQSLCQVISTCAPSSSPVTSSNCYSQIQSVTNIAPLLGASANLYPTLGALISANLTGPVRGNTTTATSTVNQILGQSCSSTAVQNVYSNGSLVYSNAAALVPTSSNTIFPTPIFRSVGPNNTTALATGTSNAMTISGATATFASALPNNVGVGDAIQFQNSSTWYIAFICGRTSSTSYCMQNVSGGQPTATASNTGWSIFRAYTSSSTSWGNNSLCGENTGINIAVQSFDGCHGSSTDMVTNNTQWNFAMYADAVETFGSEVFADGWSTSASNYLRIYAPYLATDVGVSQRHNGAWSNSAYEISYTPSSSTAQLMAINMANNTLIDGLQIYMTVSVTPQNGNEWFPVDSEGASNIQFSNNIVQVVGNSFSTNCSGLSPSPLAGSSAFVWNNIFYASSTTPCTGEGGIVPKASGGTASIYLYNNTIVNFTRGIDSPYVGSEVYAKNNIVQGASGSGGYQICCGASYVDSDYNISNTTLVPGGAHDKRSATVTFMNPSAGDYRLSSSDTTAAGAGENLSSDPYLPFSTDIQGLFRTDPWSIGASNP